MPELPEVETVKNVLIPVIKNRKIINIDILRKNIIEGDKDEFVKFLTNETFLDIKRIGKYLIFILSNEKVLISHLRMEGKYYDLLSNEENSKYARVIFYLDNGHKLIYDDSRTFGKMTVSSINQYRELKQIKKLGPEPFVADYQKIYEQVKNKTTPIKTTLLDQSVLTGLGNIYVDETLYLSKINPLTATKDITLSAWQEIIKNACIVLSKAIEEGGSTIRSYHPGKGIDGNFQVHLLAYSKKDTPCLSCSHLFRFKKIGGRGSTYCSYCQPYVGKKISVAIYGKTGAGKSTVLNIFKKQWPTISADEIVKELYKDKDVIKKINHLFHFDFVHEVDKDVLRKHLLNNPQDIKKINHLIHPLVKERTKQFINSVNQGLVISEVPLLFESKMDQLFDVLIYVDTSKEKQNENLLKRDSNKTNELLNINNRVDQKEKYADYVISNDKDLAHLEKQVQEIINKLKSRLN